MLNATRSDSPGVQDGKVILRFLADDQKRYDLALTPRAASEAVVAILRSASSLPAADQAVIPEWNGDLYLAVGPTMNAAFVFRAGGVQIAMPLTEAQLTSLRDDMSAHLMRMATRQ